MDENLQQELQSTRWFNKYHQLLKKALRFLVSLSLFSFLLTYSSPSYSDFFHYWNFHFPALIFSSVSQALERKYIFLICNGILAVLAKNLSFTSSSSSDFIEDVVKTVSQAEAAPVEYKEATMGSTVESVQNVSGTEEEEDFGPLMDMQEVESPVLIAGTEEEEEEEEEGEEGEEEKEEEYQEPEESECLIPPPSAEDDGNSEVNVNTDELNRKIEEFIRKMKEEIRIEAQQQLIDVHCTS